MRFGISTLDVRLSVRMLARYPGITLVGGLAIAFAVWVGAGAFEIVTQVAYPRLPLDGGSRIVGVQQLNRTTARAEAPRLHDFAAWAEELRTVEQLGAFRLLERNLIGSDGRGEPVEVAEITATAFRVSRVPPLLGRHLVAADEARDAEPVAVIGYDVWQQRFAGDAGIIGREIRLGRGVHTVVGVMPAGYAFPVSQSLWVPLRLDPLAYAAGDAPRVRVFGRLARGAALADAQAELAAIGERVAADSPGTHEHLQPRVLPYAKSIFDLPAGALLGLGAINTFVVMLLVLICGNVALLLFARAAARESELVVRSALGASRRRIIMQLFTEALVLAALGAIVGLSVLDHGLAWAFERLRLEFSELPFWVRPGVSPMTVLYAALLTLLAAAIAGIVPGRKAARGLRARLQHASAGGGGFRFGGVWTVVIVAQIALTAAFPVVTYMVHRESSPFHAVDLGFPDDQYLSVRLEMDASADDDAAASPASAGFRARYAAAVARLEARLLAEPGVERVTFGDRLPRMYHPHRLIDVDDGGAAPLLPQYPAYRVSSAHVAPDFFETFDAPVLAGRGFHTGDAVDSARVVIVNESFVENVLGGRNPIGRRLRYVSFEERSLSDPDAEPWYEIVGVVRDLGQAVGSEHDPKVAGFYHPITSGGVYPGHFAVHVRGEPARFAARLRSVAAQLEPELRLYGVEPLDQANTAELRFLSFWFWLSFGVSGVAMFLSLAGIYAVMSFTVAQRTREIGIRVALGGTAGRVVRSIFRRPLTQIGVGVSIGMFFGTALVMIIEGANAGTRGVAVLAAYAAVITGVCLLACVLPTRRALAVEPTEALKATP